MKVLAVLTICVVSAALATWENFSEEEKQIFHEWCRTYDKTYKNFADEQRAMENVLKNKKEVDAHNKLYDQGIESYSQGLWRHSDLSEDEQKKFLYGADEADDEEDERSQLTRSKRASPSDYPAGPPSIDWSQRGLVGPVGDQGHVRILFSLLKTSI